ncbi:alpha/beta fold hydrolase [Brevibacillus borstelensis]|uniref:alpha/beta fold hydrolase n=1 Tax=Brevibacillus borstelensis TaxID=45462 RepID=UPI00046848DD|nr:alpha/beta hydrolase [Brevibacillus borstelensis]MCM3470619.1 alpha/beta hydrolase [Brevibacillus borstelensis]MED1852022.1 alpha/beta hydrolase [Brevibacillus borstelensis]
MKKAVLQNGVELAYDDRGTGDAVCLVHGFCGSSAYWKKLFPRLEKSSRVLAPDLRGHGGSSVPDETYTVEKMAEDLAFFMDETGIEKMTLLGHSLGGYVALAFAERYPDRLSAMGLIHSTAFPDDEQAKENRTKGMESIRQNGIEPFIKALVPKLFAPGALSRYPEEWERVKQVGLQTPPDGAIRTLEAMRERADRQHVLRKLACPVLLIAGKQDQIIPADKTFTADGANVTRVLLAEAGHMGMLETPEKMADAIKQFLSNI